MANKYGARPLLASAKVLDADISEKRTLTLILHYIPPREAFPRQFEGRHWSTRSSLKASMKQDIEVQLAASREAQAIVAVGSYKKAHLTITYCSPRGNYDLDNALSASKGWIDGLVASGVLVNDSALRLSYTVRWERCQLEETVLLVEEIR